MSGQLYPLDLYLNLTLSNDKLTATIHFTNCDEDFKVTLNELEDFLKRNYINYGVHDDILADIAANTANYLLSKTIIAEGDKPIDGDDGYIKYVFDLNQGTKKPLLMVDGTVDFKEVTSLNNVRKGELVAERIPPKEGINGKAVTGEALFAKPGKLVRFKMGKNVVMDTEQLFLFSTIDGIVTATEREKMNVFPIYEVNGDVDYKTGNIDFVGTVVIRGNVLAGFKVKAAGDIRILGSVEGADIDAAGAIEISTGIIGQNKGLIKAGKSIKTSFVQEGSIEAGEDIVISQSIMHSTVRAGRNVLCQGPKGLIVGGIIQAGEKVAARTIGNSMATNTIVEVGVLPELRNQLIELRSQLKEHANTLDKTEKGLGMLTQIAAAGGLSKEKLAMKIKLTNSKKQTLEEQDNVKQHIFEIEKSLEDTERARVEAMGVIYGGTKIVIGRYTKFIKEPVTRMYFKLQDGDIVMFANQ